MNDQGTLQLFTVKPRQNVDIGIITGANVDSFEDSTSFMTVQGTIRDEKGIPLAGVVVVAKKTLEQYRPSFISTATENDGKYSFKLPPGGYFFLAREDFQGVSRLGAGSYVGIYGRSTTENIKAPFAPQTQRKSMPLETGVMNLNSVAKKIIGHHGEIFSDLDIQLFRIPNSVETRKRIESESRARVFEDTENKVDNRQNLDEKGNPIKE